VRALRPAPDRALHRQRRPLSDVRLWKHREALAPRACLSFPATVLDDRVTARLAVAVTPTAIDLALDALTTLEARDQAIAAQWQRRVERARYEVDLAERRYETPPTAWSPPRLSSAGRRRSNGCAPWRPNWRPSSTSS
jgi:hypothetical protein